MDRTEKWHLAIKKRVDQLEWKDFLLTGALTGTHWCVATLARKIFKKKYKFCFKWLISYSSKGTYDVHPSIVTYTVSNYLQSICDKFLDNKDLAEEEYHYLRQLKKLLQDAEYINHVLIFLTGML